MLGMVWQSNRAGRVTALMRAHCWGPAALVASKAIELLHRLQETLRHHSPSFGPVLVRNAMEMHLHSSWQAYSYLQSKSVPALLLGRDGIMCRWRIWLSILNCTWLWLVPVRCLNELLTKPSSDSTRVTSPLCNRWELPTRGRCTRTPS